MRIVFAISRLSESPERATLMTTESYEMDALRDTKDTRMTTAAELEVRRRFDVQSPRVSDSEDDEGDSEQPGTWEDDTGDLGGDERDGASAGEDSEDESDVGTFDLADPATRSVLTMLAARRLDTPFWADIHRSAEEIERRAEEGTRPEESTSM